MPADGENLPTAKSLQQAVGGLLFAADRPLTVEDIRAVLRDVSEAAPGEETPRIFAGASPREVRETVLSLAKELSRLELGFELAEVNGAFRFQTQPCCGRWVRGLLKCGRPNRLSGPSLETLAIIAYRQPITKSEVEGIRGVSADHSLKSLMALRLVRIAGRSELPGRPFLYGTTATFLEHFGLRTLKELDELDPTLRRSKKSERAAAHKRPKKDAPAQTPAPAPEQTPLFPAMTEKNPGPATARPAPAQPAEPAELPAQPPAGPQPAPAPAQPPGTKESET